MLSIFASTAAKRPRFRPLRAWEQLEDRWLMASLADPSASALVGAAEPGTEAESGLARFSSAQELSDYLLQKSLAQWQDLFGKQSVEWGFPGHSVILTDLALRSFAAAESQAAAFSSTNVQVAGVDEADLVKTDGEFLYLLRGLDLLILDARPTEDLQLISRTRLTDKSIAMYLNGDRLTVIAGNENVVRNGDWAPPSVRVTVYDVADRTHPVVHRETVLDGNYIDSRQIDNRLVFVLQNDFRLPMPLVIPDPNSPPVDYSIDGGGQASDSFRVYPNHWRPGRYETQSEYLARIGDRILELALPNYRTSTPGMLEQSGLLSEATEIYRPLANDGSLTSVVVLDASGTAEAPLYSASVPSGQSGEVYASAENIYVLGTNSSWTPGTIATTIHKFRLGATGIDLVAVGSVAGTILNQFSIDEHDGFLRIATTVGFGNNGPHNNVYVLAQEGNQLNVVGRLEGLAPGERIFSVRFLGDRGFVVTFQQIDPLFAIDLSDPTQPRLAGELHIPGFSNYLQPVGENYLLGIGRDADLTGRAQGLQVSLFDVSNLADPRLIERFSIDAGNWAQSEATYDHHAVGYFSDSQTLAIPVGGTSVWSRIDTDGDGMPDSWDLKTAHSEMWVFHVDVSAGLSLLGRIELDGQVRRSVRIDDVLYSISTEMVKANALTDPSVELAVVDLSDGPIPPVDPPTPIPIVIIEPPFIQPIEQPLPTPIVIVPPVILPVEEPSLPPPEGAIAPVVEPPPLVGPIPPNDEPPPSDPGTRIESLTVEPPAPPLDDDDEGLDTVAAAEPSGGLDEQVVDEHGGAQLATSLASLIAYVQSADFRGSVHSTELADGGGFEIIVSVVPNGRRDVRAIAGFAPGSLLDTQPALTRAKASSPLASDDTWSNPAPLPIRIDAVKLLEALFAGGFWE